ncbi:hypothetical protein PISMIDRAFT_322226 [Pisolithus microcarpus 441]|uniref:Uncharacterized protein n=1 Tax=Pisolithus microcarpus 441 TaxID=765257 RepID=A0A0C9YFW9_9AGAM|nr:hypothetical protein BKA83DRAFT_322226 [Pisolithus microcarpus]KIK15451.1 hypothetical protein PISMIDRAFT_322226 [Pisolithus microcarpus 441]
MSPCTESLAFRRRGSTRRSLSDDMQDVATAFLVLELFKFLCLDRVARSGSRISITCVPYLSLFRMVILLARIYLVRPYSLRCTPWFWRYGCFRVWRRGRRFGRYLGNGCSLFPASFFSHHSMCLPTAS